MSPDLLYCTCIKVVLPDPAMPIQNSTVGCLFDGGTLAEVDVEAMAYDNMKRLRKYWCTEITNLHWAVPYLAINIDINIDINTDINIDINIDIT